MKFFITIIFSILIFVDVSYSQVNFTGYLVDKENKKMKDVVINLYKGNEQISSTKWSNKFDYDLALETYYTIELIKEGFIPKKIAVSTFQGDKGAEPFLFVMELVAVKDATKDVDSDFPSALIEYKKDEGSFDFDEDYAKNLKKAQKEALLNEKKDEKN